MPPKKRAREADEEEQPRGSGFKRGAMHRCTVMRATGKTIFFNVSNSVGIADIKERIREEEGTPVAKQHLYINGKLLGDDWKPSAFDFASGLFLVLHHRDEVVTVPVTVVTDTGRVIPLKLTGTETIYDVKRMIEDQEKILAPQQRLYYNDILLEDKDSLAQCQPEGEEPLRLLLRQPFLLHITHWELYYDPDLGPDVLHKSSSCAIEVEATETVASVKSRLALQMAVPVEKQRLVSNGEILLDPYTLLHYKMSHSNGRNSVVLISSDEQISIYIKFMQGTTQCIQSVEVRPLDTMESIKAQLEQQVNIRTHGKQLFKDSFGSVFYEDHLTLAECAEYYNRGSKMYLDCMPRSNWSD